MMENSETLSNLDYSKIKDLYINFGIFKEMYEELNGVWKAHILYKSNDSLLSKYTTFYHIVYVARWSFTLIYF
jgi:hypothetical protein